MRYLSTKDVAEMFQIPVRRARGLMRSEGFPSVKIGASYFVEAERLKQYLEEHNSIHLAIY